jgi:hypothetical protein
MATNSTEEPEKDIVSFNQALELCSIYFKSPTFCMYEIETRQLCLCHLDEEGLYIPDKDLPAPTKSQVFTWFRKNYNLHAVIIPTITMYWTFKTMTVVEGMVEVPPYNHVDAIDYPTYEQAMDACIDKLIELVKRR